MLKRLCLHSSGLVFFGFLSLSVFFLICWMINPEELYVGLDGSFYTTIFSQLHIWSYPLDQSVINPYQGMGTIFLPYNVWLTPGYIVLNLFKNNLWKFLISYGIFFGEIFFSVVFLARTLRLPFLIGVIVAQTLCIGLFPFPVPDVGFYRIFTIDPGIAHTIALGNFLVGFLVLLRTMSILK